MVWERVFVPRGDLPVEVVEHILASLEISNRSDDIRQLFTETCDLMGIAWRPWGRWHISVARRDAVALLDEHVGPKS